MIAGDASEVYALAADLSQIGAKSVPTARTAMLAAGKVVEAAWRNNAIVTSGVHGKHYPNSIDSELTFGVTAITVEVGPNAAKPQGSMGRGFEYGSQNQPPHLDGARALADNEGPIERAFDQAMNSLFR